MEIVDFKVDILCVADHETYAVYAELLVAALNSPLSALGLMLLVVRFETSKRAISCTSVESTQCHNRAVQQRS